MKQYTNEEALKIWEREIGNQTYVYDFSGKKIKKTDYLEENEVGWVIAFMRPLELGGKADEDNIMIMHHRTFEDKGLNYPIFKIDFSTYKVCHDEKKDYYYIEEVIEGTDEE